MRMLPMSIDISQGEYCASGRTNPKYRRMGFAQYTSVRAVEVLRERGLNRDRYAIDQRNVASLLTFGRFESKVCGEAHHMKLLWWRFWKEWPTDSGVAN